MLRTNLFALATLALASCASTDTAAGPPSGDRDCFNSGSVSGYNYIDANHVAISSGANRRYIMTTMFNARDLDWTQAIAIRSTSGWICTGNGLGVEVIGGDPRRHYPITAIERAPEEASPARGS